MTDPAKPAQDMATPNTESTDKDVESTQATSASQEDPAAVRRPIQDPSASPETTESDPVRGDAGRVDVSHEPAQQNAAAGGISAEAPVQAAQIDTALSSPEPGSIQDAGTASMADPSSGAGTKEGNDMDPGLADAASDSQPKEPVGDEGDRKRKRRGRRGRGEGRERGGRNEEKTAADGAAECGSSEEPVQAPPSEPANEGLPVPLEAGVAFASLGLHQRLLTTLESVGFQACTPIQGQTLPHTLANQDLVGQAQTGTGKTAAFLLTILNHFLQYPLEKSKRYASEPRALVVAPTRELALQIEKDAMQLASGLGLNILSVIGGTPLDKARLRLRDEYIDLLIATPGRLIDHMTSRDIYLDQVERLVLDEADRMLDMGFIPDVKRIVNATPRERQTLLFSATFNDDIINLSRRWTREAIEVLLATDHVPSESIDQRVYLLASDQKMKVLVNLLRKEGAKRVIVFCNRRDETRRLCESLGRRGLSAAMISGELPQQKRLKTLEQFREGKYQILVATDVAGRGLHIEGVTHVVNYNLPEDPEDYVHRIGRTGRAGDTGTSVSFACEDESFLIPDLEKYIGHKLTLIQPDEELLA